MTIEVIVNLATVALEARQRLQCENETVCMMTYAHCETQNRYMYMYISTHLAEAAFAQHFDEVELRQRRRVRASVTLQRRAASQTAAAGRRVVTAALLADHRERRRRRSTRRVQRLGARLADRRL